jgi:cytochrome c-type biogenesis protein CcmH
MIFLHKTILRKLIISSLFIFLNSSVFASNIDLQNFYKEIKCPTCPGQSIADSQSETAAIIKQLVTEEWQKGKTKEEIKEVLIQQYGKEILFATPINTQTLILWLMPVILIILGISIVRYVRIL